MRKIDTAKLETIKKEHKLLKMKQQQSGCKSKFESSNKLCFKWNKI